MNERSRPVDTSVAARPSPPTTRNPIARRRILQRELAVRGAVSVAELSAILGASAATVRRDLEALAREGIVERGHGGAAARAARPAEEALAIRERKDVEAKRSIARATAAMIREGETIFLNDGSTVMALARELASSELELFVVTCAVNVAQLLAENPRLTVCLLGGFVRRSSLATSGPFAEGMLEQFNADLAVLSSDAFSAADGMSFANADDGLLSRRMAMRAKRCVAMVTSAKFSWTARLTGVPIAEIDVVVTDSLPPTLRDALAAADVAVVTAPISPVHSSRTGRP
ncbi:MAG: DeoR/GlpR transcriptional regulator [Alphaproteobacteria bacterium]|nr:DeoR/GlpR transcriptional regulator [Alphaproteobacteria bacterium]